MDGITAPRPFEDDEQSNLSTLLKSQLNLHNVSCPFQAEADAEDLVNYIFEMVDDGENVGHVINEVRDLGFDEICSEDNLESIRDQLAEFLVSMEGKGWKNKWSVMKRGSGGGGGGTRNEERIAAVAPSTHNTRRVTQEETSPPPATPPKEDPIARSAVAKSRPARRLSYAEELQEQERARGEEPLKNSASLQATGSRSNVTTTRWSPAGGTSSRRVRPMTYAEEIQARERARGEEVLKNSASMQANMRSRAGQPGASTTVESNGLGGYSGVSGKRQMSYAEEIQARERARGEEIIKNSASMQANMRSRAGQLGANATVESNGLGFYGASGKRQMSYAEEIQARERARGEETAKNNASTQAFARRASLHRYSSSASDETPHDSDYDSPNHVDVDLSQTYVDADTKKELDEMRREELMAVMKDRSLSKEEKAEKMKDIRERYAGFV